MKNEITLRSARNLAGTLRLPGDKSISHRYAMLAALAEGRSLLENFSTGEDCAHTLACLRALGCKIRDAGAGRMEIEGQGRDLRLPSGPLDCGNSGSTMRMLAGILAAQDFSSELIGDASLSLRPMARVIEPLTAMGARIIPAEGGRPPLRISGGKLRGLDYAMPMASAQVKSSILFAGLLAEGQTFVEEPLPTRDHGELALQAFGAEITRTRNRVGIAGGQKLRAIEARIPGDLSTAAFFLCAAALFPESSLTVEDLLLNPTRAAVLDLLAAMGACILTLSLEVHNGELVGTVKLEAAALKGASISGAQTAALIDELPVLAAIAPYTEEGIEIRDARELRVKESDRIATIAAGLRAMGAEIEEREDGLRVPGRQRLRGGRVDSAGDHRIAMAFAVAALRAQGETTITGAQAVAVSYPEFFSALETLVER
ncbi:MAG: 3-phosphoshikimate 1-carboxyvinyltransferase [Terriglobales bacterium]